MNQDERPVPVRTILVTIGLVLATVAALYLVRLLARIEMLLVISLFFAVVLTPLVDRVHARMRIKRGLAAGLVFVFVIAAVASMMFVIIKPLVTETRQFAENFPTYLSDAREGRGALGGLVKRYELDRRYEENKETIENAFRNAGSKAFSYVGRAFSGVLTLLTIMVLSFMMLLYGPQLTNSAMAAVPPNRRERVKAVAADASKAVTGYVSGNLLISAIAGIVTYIALWVLGVPFKEVLALWVAFADLIPLVGATLGAIPTIAVAFLHSVPAGIGVVAFYIVYQQVENHFLQPLIMSKTVQINQLFVLVSVLVGVELGGFVGAILAIPLAGVVAVVVRDLWDNRRGRFKDEADHRRGRGAGLGGVGGRSRRARRRGQGGGRRWNPRPRPAPSPRPSGRPPATSTPPTSTPTIPGIPTD